MIDRTIAMKALLAVAIGVVVALIMRKQSGLILDDPYILYRYAEHLGQSGRWEFNPYTSTQNAVTSSLYVLILAAASFIGVSVTVASSVLFFFTAVGAASFTGLALERAGRPVAGIIAAFLVAGSPVLAAFRGMESSLFLFLIAVALFVAVDKRPPLTVGLFLGLLSLARPDGIILGIVLALVFYVPRWDWPNRRDATLLLMGTAMPLGLFGAFALATFGNPFPSTLAAKIAQGQSGQWPTFLSDAESTIVALLQGSSSSATNLLRILVIIASVGVAASVFRRSAWQIVMTLSAATAVLVLVYGKVFKIPAYPWYYALPVYTVLVLASVGADALISLTPTIRSFRALAAATLTVMSVMVGYRFTDANPELFRAEYEVAGKWLKDNTDPRATVAAMEIGKIGWYSERDMVDYLGLLDSTANDAVAQSDFLWWPSHYQPDYWVTTRTFIDSKFYASRCLDESFEPAFRTNTLTIFHRVRPIPEPAGC